MHARTVSIKPSTIVSAVLVGVAIFFGSVSEVRAEPIPAEVQAKVDKAKKKLTEWAGSPIVVAAIKDSLAKGGIAGMNNAKWQELPDNDPLAYQGRPPGSAGEAAEV